MKAFIGPFSNLFRNGKQIKKYFAILFTSTDFVMTLEMDKLNLDMTDFLVLAKAFVVLRDFLMYN